MNPTRFRNLLRIAIVISLMPSCAFAGNILSIGIGASHNNATGDPLRTAMTKIVIAVNGLAGCFNGPSEPASSMPFQCWFDTSATPPTLRYYDGTQWVGAATLNQSTHVFASLAAPSGAVGGDLGGTLPNPTINLLAVTNAKMATDIGALAGDLAGTLPSPTIAKIQGTAISGVTGTGNAVLSVSPAITGPASVSSIPFNPSVPVSNQYSLPNQPGILLPSGSSFYIAGAPTSAAQDTPASTVYISKNGSYTGVPAGFPPLPALFALNNIQGGVQGAQEGIAGIAYNFNTLTSQPDGTSGAVGIQGFGYCAITNCTATWGMTATGWDLSGQVNPTKALYGMEIDNYAHGTDNNMMRIGLQIVVGTPDGLNPVNVVGRGLFFTGDGTTGKGQFTNMIDGGTSKRRTQ